MLQTMKRRTRTRQLAVLVAAFGCTCASLSGTLAALAYSAQLESPAPADRFA